MMYFQIFFETIPHGAVIMEMRTKRHHLVFSKSIGSWPYELDNPTLQALIATLHIPLSSVRHVLYWLLSTSFRERGPLGFHRQPLSLCQVELSHRSRRGIVLFHQKKHRGMDIKSSGKACKGCLSGLPKTPSAMTLRARWSSSTSWTLAHVVQLQAAQ